MTDTFLIKIIGTRSTANVAIIAGLKLLGLTELVMRDFDRDGKDIGEIIDMNSKHAAVRIIENLKSVEAVIVPDGVDGVGRRKQRIVTPAVREGLHIEIIPRTGEMLAKLQAKILKITPEVRDNQGNVTTPEVRDRKTLPPRFIHADTTPNMNSVWR